MAKVRVTLDGASVEFSEELDKWITDQRRKEKPKDRFLAADMNSAYSEIQKDGPGWWSVATGHAVLAYMIADYTDMKLEVHEPPRPEIDESDGPRVY